VGHRRRLLVAGHRRRLLVAGHRRRLLGHRRRLLPGLRVPALLGMVLWRRLLRMRLLLRLGNGVAEGVHALLLAQLGL